MSIGYTGDNGTLDADGWTIYKPSLDSRLVYVANDGDDAEAASVHGRGYYLPTDPEIGPDPTNPLGPIKAYATPNHGWSKVRKIRWAEEVGNLDTYSNNPTEYPNVPPNKWSQSVRGYPDWLMYKRGDTFAEGKGAGDAYLTSPDSAANGFPNNTPLCNSPWRGRSSTEPAVMTAWGTPTDPRPVFTSDLGPHGFDCHVKYISLDVKEHSMKYTHYVTDGFYDEDVLVEDCRTRTLGGLNTNINLGLKYRRCTVSGGFNPNSHNQGLFISSYVGGDIWIQGASPENGGPPLTDVLIEECVFDRNGYKEDPYDASTWTAAMWGGNGSSAVAAGLGVQPRRKNRDRNIYVATSEPDRKATVTIRGTLFSRAGGGGSVQMRQGGIVERCVWLSDHDPGFIGRGDGIYKDCLRLGAEIFHNASYNNQGFFINNDYNNDWWSDATGAVIDGCIVAGGIPDGRNAFAFNSIPSNTTSVSIALLNSDAIRHVGKGIGGFNSGGFDSANWKSIIESNNRIYIDSDASWSTIDCQEAKDLQFGANSDPCRDIVSYMESIDDSFVPNEDVYIDEDCTVQQTNRLKVREAWTLYEDVPGRSGAYNRSALSDADARLRAKRYHAFLVFNERAKENRKHAWDTDYTADAINNYIREGLGKSTVSGSYDERDVTTIVSSYFSTNDVGAEVQADDVQPVETTETTSTTSTTSTTETTPSEGDGLDDIGYETLETQESPEGVGAIVNQPNYQNYIYPTYFRFTIGSFPNLEYFITKATLPSFGYDSAVDQPNRFSIIRHPANKVVFSPLELDFLVDENMNNWIELSNWIRKTSVVDDHRDVYETTSDDFTQGTLIITNSAMVPNIEVTFYNMFPISVTGFEFNSAVTELTPWTSTVTFAYDYYEVKKL